MAARNLGMITGRFVASSQHRCPNKDAAFVKRDCSRP